MTGGFLDRLRARYRPLALPNPDGLPVVRAYWEGLRQGQALPRRSDLDPRGFAGLLDRVFLADQIGRGLAQIRIAGSALSGLAGTELRGLPLGCLFTAESRPILAQVLDGVLTQPAVAEVDLGLDRQARGQPLARMLVLPVQEDSGRLSLLGAIALSPDCLVEGRLQILSRRDERLFIASPPAPRPLPGPLPRAERQPGHLTLVHSTP